jgi:hypothetical protein
MIVIAVICGQCYKKIMAIIYAYDGSGKLCHHVKVNVIKSYAADSRGMLRHKTKVNVIKHSPRGVIMLAASPA